MDDIRHQLGDILRSLGKLEGGQEAIMERLDSGSERMDKIEQRQGKTESKMNWWTGVASAASAVFGAWAGGHLPKP